VASGVLSKRLEARDPAVLESQESGGFFVRFVDLDDTLLPSILAESPLHPPCDLRFQRPVG
jgi:hypothetical protein